MDPLNGVISFIKNYLEPGLSENRETWKNLTKMLSEDLLIELHYQIDQKRKISNSDLRKLRSFVDDIINDREYLRFSFPQRGIFEKRKQKIKKHFQQLIPLISYPFWTLEDDQSLENGQSYWSFNKNYFQEEVENGHYKYIHHLNRAAELMESIRYEYRYMSIIANLSVLEFFTSKLIANRRAKLPHH
jgi:hypothetical protein